MRAKPLIERIELPALFWLADGTCVVVETEQDTERVPQNREYERDYVAVYREVDLEQPS